MTEGYGFYNLMTFIKIESMKAIFHGLYFFYIRFLRLTVLL